MNEENTKKEEAPLSELEVCKAKCDEYLNGWKRERADFLNYKKDEMERMGSMVKFANQELMIKILPILDSIHLSEKELPEHLKKGEKGSVQAIEWTKGFLQIKEQIKDFLKKEGIEEIMTLGEPFNPSTMEVVEEVEGSESGKVVEELQKGYMIQGKVIRPSKVKISK